MHERTNAAMGINYCDALMYWKAKERAKSLGVVGIR